MRSSGRLTRSAASLVRYGGVTVAALLVVGTLFLAACGSNVEESGGASIDSSELARRIQGGSAPIVVDVRTRKEYASGHIPGSVNIPLTELPTRMSELPSARSEEIVVHCQSGRRAEVAEGVLRADGYTNVRPLSGHWQGWQAAGLPAE